MGNQFLKLTFADLAPAPLWDFRINQVQKTIARVVASECMSRVGILEIPRPGQKCCLAPAPQRWENSYLRAAMWSQTNTAASTI
jgi:hypothetical protein